MPGAVPETQGSDSLLGHVAQHTSDKVRRAITTYAIGMTAWRIGKQWWNRAVAELTYQVSVPGDDELYADLHRWLLDELPSSRRRALTARTTQRSGSMEITPADRTPTRVSLFFDGTRTQTVTLDGHRVKVQLERRDMASPGNTDNEPRWVRALERIIFTANGEAARDAVLEFLQQIADAQKERKPRLQLCSAWGNWMTRSDVAPRQLDSVVLRAGQRDILIDDLATFLALEADYNRLGLPWHRAMLFHGPPGTGKSSMAAALASYFGMDVYWLSLPALQNDGRLFEALSNIQPRSLLLLEDIDIIHAARERSDSEPGVTMSGLLNGLDGMITPHGLITILTTNDLDVLDPALVRPGRVDRVEFFDVLDDRQLAGLVDAVLGTRPPKSPHEPLPSLRERSMSPAEAVEILKPYLDDPTAGRAAIRSALEIRR